MKYGIMSPAKMFESILVSAGSEKRWVMEMEKNFPAAADIDLDTPCCVFRVSETNLESCAPRLIGVGPYHHLRPELYTMTQRKKLAAVRRFLNHHKLSRVHEVVEALLERDAVARACYDHYIDLDAVTLSWILAIDGLFLLCYLYALPAMKEFVGDVFMLENQIPFLVLKKILSLFPQDEDDDEIDPQLFGGSSYYDFCKANSPLELMDRYLETDEDSCFTHSHLLHYMYHLIVSNRGIKEKQPMASRRTSAAVSVSALDIEKGFRFLGQQGVPGAEFAGNIISAMEKVPWEKILALFNRGDVEQLPPVDEIDVPTVSQMAQVAGIAFIPTQGGIRDVLFNEEEKRFSLPIITFKPHSEILLRNLVAYEAASANPGATLEFAHYVDLMCGIIDTTEDVGILKKAGIVRGDGMSDAEIAPVCNGIKRSTGNGGGARSNIEEAIQNVSRRYDDVWSVKLRRCLEKWFAVSWKIVCAAVAVAVVVVLTVQAFCTVFGCPRWFGTAVRFPLSYVDH